MVLDLTQSLGVVPISGHALSCTDFAVASTHKWLLGLYGIAVMWVNPEGIGKVRTLSNSKCDFYEHTVALVCVSYLVSWAEGVIVSL